DHYEDMDDIRSAFLDFANRVPFYGVSVLCVDDAEVRGMLHGVTKRTLLYGTRPEAAVRADGIELMPHGSRVPASQGGSPLGLLELRIPRRHNVLNALAAGSVGLEAEVAFRHIPA